MAHEVETAFYAKTPAWHGLGTVVSEAKNSQEAIKLAKLDWTVVQEKMFLADGREIPDRLCNIRSTDKKILGMISDHYKYDDPIDAFAFTDALLENEEIEVLYDAVGSLFEGKRIWISAHLPERLILGDKFGTHLIFATSYNGSLANTALVAPNRVECNNMLTRAIANCKNKWTYRHMGNMEEHKKEAANTLKLACKYMDGFEVEAEELQQKKITKKMLGEIIELVFPVDEEDSDRVKTNVADLRNQFFDIYAGAADLKAFRGDAWGVYNAFGDFATHIKPIRQTKNFQEKLFSSFIDGNKLLLKAQDVIAKITA